MEPEVSVLCSQEPATCPYSESERMCGVIPQLPNTPSWRGADLKNHPSSTEPEGSLLCSQNPATCPYSDSDEYSPHLLILFL